ncbi:MAG: galactokinase, partial [Calditrichaeota bacterium]
KPRMLVDSHYNQRRAECQQAVELLQQRFPEVKSLRDVTMEQLKDLSELLPPTLLRRTRHVVTENARVLASLDAFRWDNLYAFGSLMLSSHLSLKEDFEVSCPELDFLVDMVMMQNGSLGARLTGAGFGGCTVNLVETEQTEAIFARVGEKYREKFGLQAQLYLCEAAEGAKVVWRE